MTFTFRLLKFLSLIGLVFSSCHIIRSIPNGKVNSLPLSWITTYATIRCNKGYLINGTNHNNIRLTCKQGRWNPFKPSCQPKERITTNPPKLGGMIRHSRQIESSKNMACADNAYKGCFDFELQINLRDIWDEVMCCYGIGRVVTSDNKLRVNSLPFSPHDRLSSTTRLDWLPPLIHYVYRDRYRLIETGRILPVLCEGTVRLACACCNTRYTTVASSPPDLRNGTFNYTSTVFKSNVTYRCSDGFKLEGQSTKTCNSDGQWTNETIACHPKDCHRPSNIANGRVHFTLTTYSSKTSYSCNVGYRLQGPANSVCQSNGHWSNGGSKCLPIDCGKPGALFHGQVHYTRTTLASTASYICDNGFLIHGQSRVKCQSDGRWSNSGTRCVPKDCSVPPQIPNGKINYNTTTYMSNASYTCDEGYTVQRSNPGFTTVTCQANGTWSDRDFECRQIHCGAISQPAHGKVTHNSTFYRAVANFTCDTGYWFTDNTDSLISVTCLQNGAWSRKPPICKPKPKDCHRPPHVVNARIEYTSTAYSAIATYTCNRGFVTPWTNKHAENITCQSNGHWSDPETECLPIDCGKLKTPSHGLVTVQTTTYLSKAKYTCDTGYTINGTADAFTSRICEWNGQWSDRDPFCIIRDCQRPRGISNGAIIYNNTIFGSVALFLCNDGYTVRGTNKTTVNIACEPNGHWSDFNMECEPIECGQLQQPENGKVTTFTTTYLSKATYECNNGYIINGTREAFSTRTCLSNGTWSWTEPVCVIIDCHKPRIIANGFTHFTNTTYNSVAKFECNVGYEIDGSNKTWEFVKCGLDGHWSKQDMECSPIGTFQNQAMEEECVAFYNNRSAWGCLARKKANSNPCPCTEANVQHEMTFHPIDVQTAFHRSLDQSYNVTCFQEWFYDVNGVKQTCCYEYGTLITSDRAGGVPEIQNDECGATVGYTTCCVESQRFCYLYYKMNPPDNCHRFTPSLVG